MSATLLGGDLYDAIWAEREHLALGLAVGLLGLAVVGELLRVGRQGGDDVHVGTVSVTNFLFYASVVRCCPLWFCRAVRGL